MTDISRNAWDNIVLVVRDGALDSTWDGKVKNLIYDVGSMAWVSQTATAASGGGDASAANQTTEIAKLTSIDGKTPALGQALMAGSVPVAIASNQGAVPVSLASLPSLAAGTAVIGHVIVDTAPSTAVTNAGTFPVQATLAAETTKVIGTVNIAASQTIGLAAGAAKVGQVAIDQTTPGTTNLVSIGTSGTVGITSAAATAKATQGANGIPTQDLKDAGRSARTISLDSFAVAATTETLNTMSYSTDNGTATTGTSYAVTTAKRLRVQQITASLHTIAGNTTAANVIVRIRVNNGGAALVSSPIQMVFALPGVAAALSASTPVTIPIPDGWEFVAGAGIGVTTTCAGFITTTAAPKVNITITGYEY